MSRVNPFKSTRLLARFASPKTTLGYGEQLCLIPGPGRLEIRAYYVTLLSTNLSLLKVKRRGLITQAGSTNHWFNLKRRMQAPGSPGT